MKFNGDYMINAKQEFLHFTKGHLIKCACLEYGADFIEREKYILPAAFSISEYEKFLNDIDFEYSNGYGTQNLFGTVWFKNGTWLERWEYNGSEGWEHKKVPPIPNELNMKLLFNPHKHILNIVDNSEFES